MRLLIIDKTAGLVSSHERHQAIADLPGVELHVFGPRRWIENGREVIWNARGDERYRSHVGRVLFAGYYARHFYCRNLVNVIRLVKPDVVQLLEEPWSIVAGQVLLAGRVCPRFALLFYTWENIYRAWRYPSRLSRLYACIDRRVHHVSVGALCATREAEEVLRRKGYPHPTAVVPYGIRSHFFHPIPRSHSGNRPFTVGYIGRLLWMKGVDLLIRATAQLPQARLVLVGGGRDEGKFRSLVSDLGLEGRVQFHPPVCEEDVPSWLASFDVLVLPSRTTPGWKEQLGRILIEAMALGVPAIGARSGAIPEVLGREDLLFTEENVDEMAAILARVQSDSVWRNEIRMHGCRRARERFSWGTFASSIGDFYRQLGLI